LIPFCADLASTQAPTAHHLIDFGHPIESGSGRGRTPLRSLFEQWLAEREYSVRPMKRKWRRDATIHETAYGPVASAAANVLVFTLILLREKAKPVEGRDLVLLEDVYPADEVPVARSKAPYLSFFRIQLPWLRNVARRYVLNKIEHKELSPRTLPSYIASLGQIEACLYSLHSSPRPEHITQEFIEHTFLSWGNDKGFIGQNWYTDPLNMVQWASAYLPEYRWRRLVFDKRNVRRVRSYHPRTHEYERNLEDAMVPEEVIEQIFLRFDSLPVVCKRLLIIARYTGMRSIDLHALAFGCLAPDPDDAAHALVIQAIQDQQDDVRRAWRRETQYLFPHRLGDAEVHLSPGHTRDVIAKWIIRQGIRDKDGGIYRFGWHDLRHFYGTELALAGYDIMMIQMELGHASADMSLIYINQRLKLKKKAVLEKGGGKFISIKGEVDDKIAELALRKDASLAVDVPGGLCSLPGQIGEWCEHNGACFTCTYFRADIGQLPFFEKKMRTMAASLTCLKGEVEGFEHDGHRRMADIGRKRMERTQQGLANVKTIIKTIRAKGSYSGQARKYQRAACSGAAAECDQAACGRGDPGCHAPER
jgi:integrase